MGKHHRDIISLLFANIFAYIKSCISSSKILRAICEGYSSLQIHAQKNKCEKSPVNKSNSFWSQDVIEEFVLAISNNWIRSWSEYICNIDRLEYYSRDAKSIPKQNGMPGNVYCHDLARDIEEELRGLLSFILSKIRSTNKMRLINDVLSLLRCHLKGLSGVVNNHTSTTKTEVNEAFPFQHYVKRNEFDKKKHYFEVSVQRLLSSYSFRKNTTTMKTALINKLLNQLIAHQIFMKLADEISEPKYIHSYLVTIFSEKPERIEEKSNVAVVTNKDVHDRNGCPLQLISSEDEIFSKTECNTIGLFKMEEKSNLGSEPCPEYIDLTGYKIRSEHDEESVRNSNVEKINVNRGSGKVSEALGEYTVYTYTKLILRLSPLTKRRATIKINTNVWHHSTISSFQW